MTSRLHIDALTVRYPGRPAPALTDVSLDIRPGERLGITGRTGAGKSTLALVSSGLIPRVVRAAVSGRVVVDDVDALAGPTGSLLGRCGIVFASPADQLSGAKPTVRDELAFGLENLGVARTDMDPRIDVVLAELGIAHLADREPGSLSGGEMQRVAIASIVAMGPGLLVLDEPTAELDPDGTMAVAALIDRLAGAGTSILCVGHEPRILERCDRVLTLEVGALVSGSVVRPAIPPLTWSIEAGRPGVGVSIEDVGFRYPDGVEALRDVSLEVRPGERVAVVGANGSGKTTLAKQLIGLLRPTSGRVLLDGVPTQGHSVQTLAETVGFAFQDPADQLFERSVEREVAFGPRQLGRTGIELDTLIEAALAMTGLTGERATNPYDLDRSVRKLVTLAGVLAMDPGLLVLDEPTTGQDPEGTERVGRVVEAMAAAGRTVIAITHDPVFADRWFDRTVVMAAGRALGHPPPGA